MTRRALPIADPGIGAPAVGEAHHLTKGLVRVTMACNERCPFCNVPVEDYPEPTPTDAELDAQLEAFLASGEQTLTLSGGEPTLRRGPLLDVIARARARGVPFAELQTNAILIDDRYARELVEAGLTSAFVSLLSDDAALHDELKGTGVLSIAILPGSVDTDMLAKVPFPPDMTAEAVAEVMVYYGLDAPAAVAGARVQVYGS